MESTIWSGVSLLDESLAGLIRGAGFAAVEEARKGAEGRDTGCHNCEIEFETGSLLADRDGNRKGGESLTCPIL